VKHALLDCMDGTGIPPHSLSQCEARATRLHGWYWDTTTEKVMCYGGEIEILNSITGCSASLSITNLSLVAPFF